MKLVRIVGGRATKGQDITEAELLSLVGRWDPEGVQEGQTPYELLRLVQSPPTSGKPEVLVVYRDNRVLRSRNAWFEHRALAQLANELRTSVRHNIPGTLSRNGHTLPTDVDGELADSTAAVEVKYATMTKKTLDFLNLKRQELGYDHLHVIAPRYSDDLQTNPTNVSLWKLEVDFSGLWDYYNGFKIPEWFRPVLGPRHVRFLLSNGTWKGITRRIADTSKSSAEDKLGQQMVRLRGRNNQFPVKIYYSLARATDPLGEFRGRGVMTAPVVMGFDFDSAKHQHIFTPGRGCELCLSPDVWEQAEMVGERLTEQGHYYVQCFSGSKGFHFYLLDDEGKVRQTRDLNTITNIIDSFGCFDDFRSKDGVWDMHRIFKIPGTVDATTGYKVVDVSSKDPKLPFKDRLEKVELG